MRTCLLAVLMIVPATALFGDEPPPAFVCAECPIVEQGPAVDGTLDDACWDAAARLTDFARFSTGGAVPVQTEVAVVCDASNLYIAVRAIEPTPEGIVADNHGRDNRGVFGDDCIEIFVDANHDHESYFQFGVNSTGDVYDSLGKDSSWSANAIAAGALGDGEWTLEVAIDFQSLGVKPAAGTVIGFNVCRDDQVRSVWSSWAPMEGSFHRPAWFGHLVLGNALAQAVRRTHDDFPHRVDRPVTIETGKGTLVLSGSGARIGALADALAPRASSLRAGTGAMSETAFDRDVVAKGAHAALAEYDAIVPALTSAPETAAAALALRRRLEALAGEITDLEMAVRLASIFAK